MQISKVLFSGCIPNLFRRRHKVSQESEAPVIFDAHAHVTESGPCLKRWISMYEEALLKVGESGVEVPCFNFGCQPEAGMVEKVARYLEKIEIPEDPEPFRPEPTDWHPSTFKSGKSRVMAFAYDFLICASSRDPTFVDFIKQVEQLSQRRFTEEFGLKYFYWPLWASYTMPEILGEYRWDKEIIFSHI
ncbi:hypothetical protein DSO57_1024532 [Entomophthora muscae]|uniref:Uncharacterized protein n=1 Tax=Entomophthora muscae TaxID=34485 RepID=A0ACC2UCE8_9FUNG|nr:hypothetical protein DSO57_1024532 [Entomophthora muscae]